MEEFNILVKIIWGHMDGKSSKEDYILVSKVSYVKKSENGRRKL